MFKSHSLRSGVLKLTLRQIFLALLGVAGSLLVIWLITERMTLANISSDQQVIAEPTMPVNSMCVSSVHEISQQRTFVGTVRAKSRSDLGFEISGKIAHVFVDEGDTVSLGAPLARLEQATFEAQRRALAAALEAADARLAELRSGPRQETIASARAMRDAAASRLELAQANLERRQTLYRQGAISREEFDESQFTTRSATAEFDSASQQLAELESGTRQEQIDAQLANRNQLQASLAEIDVTIEKSTLIAPFEGTITKRFLDDGSIAAASSPVVRLVQDQKLEAWIGLPIETARQIEIGSSQTIRVGSEAYQGTLIARINEVDPLTRTQMLVWKLAGANLYQVVSGQLCEVDLENSIQIQGFWIPLTALAKGFRGLWAVMVIDSEGRVERRDVEILHTDTDRVLVRGTLVEGERIVRDGVHRITPGQRVTWDEVDSQEHP